MRLKGKLFAIVPTLILIVFKNFAIVTILFQIISGAEKAKTQSPTHSLTLQRILSEFNEICSQGISFDTPFNSSRDEVLRLRHLISHRFKSIYFRYVFD